MKKKFLILKYVLFSLFMVTTFLLGCSIFISALFCNNIVDIVKRLALGFFILWLQWDTVRELKRFSDKLYQEIEDYSEDS